MNNQQHIHIVGICGVATSALAIAFKNRGWKVTGSDKGFFPPVSTELERNDIAFYAGWHPEKMGMPDYVIVGTASGSTNPETQYAREKNIPIYSFAEAIGEFLVKENSIVCVGTWGKTSSSALLSYILEKADFNPSYMFGGVSLSHESSGKITDSKWSVCEGDEYKSGPTDPTPKFQYYKPTHLLLTAVSWDHADLYPTEESFIKTFEKLVASVGFIVACRDNEKVVQVVGDKKVVWYGKENADYIYSDIIQTKDGLDFKINDIKIHSPMIGTFQAENITGCFAIAHTLGIDAKIIVEAVAGFKGLKRRLEKRLDGDIVVFDDIAHSPEKASFVLKNLRSIYTGKIITIFEPNIGGRSRESIGKYDNAFRDSDTVFIARLTKLKIGESDRPMEGNELTEIIAKTHSDVRYIEDDDRLVQEIKAMVKDGDVVAFLGSHGFRGMIEAVITSLRR